MREETDSRGLVNPPPPATPSYVHKVNARKRVAVSSLSVALAAVVFVGHRRTSRMVRSIPVIYGTIFAAVATPVFGAVLLVILAVVPPIIDTVAVSGPNGVGKSSIAFGESWLLFVTIGLLSIVGSIALALLISGDTNDQPQTRGPF